MQAFSVVSILWDDFAAQVHQGRFCTWMLASQGVVMLAGGIFGMNLKIGLEESHVSSLQSAVSIQQPHSLAEACKSCAFAHVIRD